ncbi:hypothetical protein T11_7792 [Trichinella zimbabwensis]|uniref:Uncharacterized protein n=1 Tax=Trichinella zimbabwensis TaxID=268475 RepID=A0A0V1HMH6_9BILA|nr:hypothetical protein T11_7792 [Trichinella zimbabwensis]
MFDLENAFQELIGQYAFIILMCSRVCETINCAKCLKQLSGGPFIRLLTEGVNQMRETKIDILGLLADSCCSHFQKLNSVTMLCYCRRLPRFLSVDHFRLRGIDWPVPINTVACRGDNRPSVRFNTTKVENIFINSVFQNDESNEFCFTSIQ